MSNAQIQHKRFAVQPTVHDKTQQSTPTTLLATNPPDSTTRVYLRLHGVRTTMTVRIKPELKEAFTRRTRELGLSTCHVAEGLISGWLVGLDTETARVHQSPTINLTLVRDVKRVRRYVKEVFEDVVESEVETVSREGCCVCGGVGFVVASRRDKSRVCLCLRHFTVERKGNLVGWKVLE